MPPIIQIHPTKGKHTANLARAEKKRKNTLVGQLNDISAIDAIDESVTNPTAKLHCRALEEVLKLAFVLESEGYDMSYTISEANSDLERAIPEAYEALAGGNRAELIAQEFIEKVTKKIEAYKKPMPSPTK